MTSLLARPARPCAARPRSRSQNCRVLGAVGAAVVVELDVEAGEIGEWALLHLGDQFVFADAFLPGADHDGRAVRVVGAEVNAPLPAQLLEADPNIGLQVLDQVADVDMAVGVRQGAGDQDSPHGFLAPAVA